MNELLRLSVVVVSHGRPDLLRRCLVGLSQQDLPEFEIVVIADQSGLDAIKSLPFAGLIKTEHQHEPNISKARNQGIALAAGEIVAFIDDDAVPDRAWATHMLRCFDAPEIAAATGLVLGRNGISVQWGKMSFDHLGRDYGPRDETHGPYLKLHGTNLGLRRERVIEMGGFDEAFHFYLDETDLALRLHKQSLTCVFETNTVVHHGFAESTRRHQNRAPKSLFEIGASLAVFLRKHAEPNEIDPALSEFRDAQAKRLSGFQKAGYLSTSDGLRLMADLEDGIADGSLRPLEQHPGFADPKPFQAFREKGAQAGPTSVLSGRWWRRHRLRKKAAELVKMGHRPTLILLHPTPLAHWVSFNEAGFWEQKGGQYGRSDRNTAPVQFWGFRARIRAETERLRNQRQ